MRRIAIVGGGFSGTAVAVQLLRHAAAGASLQLTLIERSGRPGPGLAYGTPDPAHLLNVPAGNMSALADDPGHFLRHARAADADVQPQSFLPRGRYGAYLQALLADTARSAAPQARLDTWTGEVTALDDAARGITLHLADGRHLQADQVVLALGHARSSWPDVVPPALRARPHLVSDPWQPGALDALPAGPVLLLGSGLTALDLALTLLRRDPARTVTCLSRRGRAPAPHRVLRDDHDPRHTAALVQALWPRLGQGARADLRALRAAVQAHAAHGGDWRDLIAALRPHTPAWWRATPLAERQRFLRHLQPWWDSLRHRCAPQAAQAWAAARATGRLQVHAGRLRAVQPAPGGLVVHWTPRGHTTEHTLPVVALVNCTGTQTRPSAAHGLLVEQLLALGLLQPDVLGLGAAVDAHGAPLDRSGRPHPRVHVIGPWLRARDWEAVAVPELRVHALRLAQRLLAQPG